MDLLLVVKTSILGSSIPLAISFIICIIRKNFSMSLSLSVLQVALLLNLLLGKARALSWRSACVFLTMAPFKKAATQSAKLALQGSCVYMIFRNILICTDTYTQYGSNICNLWICIAYKGT